MRLAYARVVVELELRYVQRPLYIYIPIYIPIYRKIAASCTTRLARSRSPIRKKTQMSPMFFEWAIGTRMNVELTQICIIFLQHHEQAYLPNSVLASESRPSTSMRV